MSAASIYELIGFIASLLIVVSITQKSILRLRIIGLIGSVTFLAYGFLIQAYPIVLVNGAATLIHLWYLRKLTAKRSEVFRVLPVRTESNYLVAFLDHYADEITNRFQPEFEFAPDEDQIVAFVLRDMVPAGLFIAKRRARGVVEILLDFATPEYRDFRMADYLFSDESGLFEPTDQDLLSWASAPEHVSYLGKVGFRPDPARPGAYRRPIRVAS